jgi:glycosyltransferase involved in cell wall biosynthesis
VPQRPRILMIAYACRPGEGSEPGMGWNRAVECARDFDTWVLCEDERNRTAIERYFAQQPRIAGLHFVFVRTSPFDRWLKQVPGFFYTAYRRWHQQAYEVARKAHAEQPFDLVHQVGYCGYREPGYGWKLPAPFVWGPIGGTHNYPWSFLPQAGVSGAIIEALRSLANTCQFRFRRRVRQALETSALTFAGNSTTQRHFEQVYGRALPILPGNGISNVVGEPRSFTHDGCVRILWSGRLHPLKGLPLLLKALAQLGEVPFHLRVLGDGPARASYERLARRLGIAEHVEWEGWVPHEEIAEHYHWADTFVFTSLRDTMPGALLESLAFGLPVICLDHLGMGDAVDETCGIKVPVTSSRAVVAGLASAVQQIVSDAAQWERLSAGAVARAARYTWQAQARELADAYRRILHQPVNNVESARESNHTGNPVTVVPEDVAV